jgi:hypothetical protein
MKLLRHHALDCGPFPGTPHKFFGQPQVADHYWHASQRLVSTPSLSEKSDYHPLLLPLAEYYSIFLLALPVTDCHRILRDILECSSPTSELVSAIEYRLEIYFYNLPPSLLKFSNLAHVYQSEAMIWFHGLYMILCKPLETESLPC